jgi:hypothetical protein
MHGKIRSNCRKYCTTGAAAGEHAGLTYSPNSCRIISGEHHSTECMTNNWHDTVLPFIQLLLLYCVASSPGYG